MMSKKQWFVLLCLFILYLLLGASIFLYVESQEEHKRIRSDIREMEYIEELLWTNYQGNNKSIGNLFQRLSDYCGKPVHYNMSSDVPPIKWNYYNSIFFVITVVSTIGYGNLAPTTMFTRIFMIFYGLIGIPMNGIVMVTLGEFFGRSFTKLYQRWKKLRLEKSTAKLGLIGQIILYAVPGLTFFIFLPSTIISFFEGWEYDISVYYAFVTLTTIGFGDYVAGTENIHNFHPWIFLLYHIFLLVWVTGGLGYVIMIIGFITKGMRSHHVHKLERILAHTVKTTPVKLRNELRSMLHELLFMRVKPVYKGEFQYTPHYLDRSQSCPNLCDWSNKNSPTLARKRAMSECYKYSVLEKVQSESELDKIDIERTFRPSDALMKQKDLLLKVVDALSLASTSTKDDRSVHGFTDEEILASERVNERPITTTERRRAISDVKPPHKYLVDQPINTWYGNDAARALKMFNKERRAMSAIPSENNKLEKNPLRHVLQKTVAMFRKTDNKDVDAERQVIEEPFSITRSSSIALSSVGNVAAGIRENVLEQTSIAELIRALSAVATDDPFEEKPQRKIGVTSLTPAKGPPRKGSSISTYLRRTSLIPTNRVYPKPRRFSMIPVNEHTLNSPPPYTECTSARNSIAHISTRVRRFSVRPTVSSSTISPVKSQLNKRKNTESDKDS